MGYALFGERRDFYCNIPTYSALLELAYDHGWKPQGTLPPDDPQSGLWEGEWNGSYFGNGYQMVTDEDARAIADALERVPEDQRETLGFAEFCPESDWVVA